MEFEESTSEQLASTRQKMQKLAAEINQWQDDYRRIPLRVKETPKESIHIIEDIQLAIATEEQEQELRTIRDLHRVTSRLTSSLFDEYSHDSVRCVDYLRSRANEIANQHLVERSMALETHRQLCSPSTSLIRQSSHKRTHSAGNYPSMHSDHDDDDDYNDDGNQMDKENVVKELDTVVPPCKTRRSLLDSDVSGPTSSSPIQELRGNVANKRRVFESLASSMPLTGGSAQKPPLSVKSNQIKKLQLQLTNNDSFNTADLESSDVTDLSSAVEASGGKDAESAGMLSSSIVLFDVPDDMPGGGGAVDAAVRSHDSPAFGLRRSISCGELANSTVMSPVAMLPLLSGPKSPSSEVSIRLQDEIEAVLSTEVEEPTKKHQEVEEEEEVTEIQKLVSVSASPRRRAASPEPILSSLPNDDCSPEHQGLHVRLSLCPQSSMLFPSSSMERPKGHSMVMEQRLHEELQRLQDVVANQNARIHQISKALLTINDNVRNTNGVGSAPFIECNRLLCCAVQRRNAAMQVLGHLNNSINIPGTCPDPVRERILSRLSGTSVHRQPFVSQTTITDIRIQLRPGYTLAPMATQPGLTAPLHLVYLEHVPEQHLIVLACRPTDSDKVLFTQMINVVPVPPAGGQAALLHSPSTTAMPGAARGGEFVDIPTCLSLSHVSPDMELQLSVFVMTVARVQPLRSHMPTTTTTASSSTHGISAGQTRSQFYTPPVAIGKKGKQPPRTLNDSISSLTSSATTASGTSSGGKWLLNVLRAPLSASKKFSAKKHAQHQWNAQANLSPSQLMEVFTPNRYADYGGVGGHGAIKSAGFTSISELMLNLENLENGEYLLPNVSLLTPITGIMKMQIQTSHEPTRAIHDHANVFRDVNGYASWSMWWCLCHGDQLIIYASSSDFLENRDPLMSISLRDCVSDSVDIAPRLISARPHTLLFYYMTHSPHSLDHDNSQDTLVQKRVGDWIVHKCLLAMTSAESARVFGDHLNSVLQFLRSWYPEETERLRNLYRAATDCLEFF